MPMRFVGAAVPLLLLAAGIQSHAAAQGDTISQRPNQPATMVSQVAQERVVRTDEEIQIVFDRYKAALYRLYNRELRNVPTLRGQMVLRATIEPSGVVSFVELLSTDMNAPALVEQVLERVRTFDFGAKDAAPITIVYPIDFLPYEATSEVSPRDTSSEAASSVPSTAVTETPAPTSARQRAESAGLIAFRESLEAAGAERRPASRIGAASEARLPTRSLVTSLDQGSSGGVNLSSLSRQVGGDASGTATERAVVPTSPQNPDGSEVVTATASQAAESPFAAVGMSADKIVSTLPAGTLLFNAPSVMNVGHPQEIKLVLTLQESQLAQIKAAFPVPGDVREGETRVSDVMSATLSADSGAFAIVAIDSQLQGISGRRATTWRWSVTPQKEGRQVLHLSLWVQVLIDGNNTPVLAQTFDSEIEIQITSVERATRFVEKYWQFSLTALLLPLIGYLGKRHRERRQQVAPAHVPFKRRITRK